MAGVEGIEGVIGRNLRQKNGEMFCMNMECPVGLPSASTRVAVVGMGKLTPRTVT